MQSHKFLQKVGDVDLVWTKVVFTENFPNTITFESQTGSSIFSNYFESEMFQTWSIREQKICFARTRIHSFLYPAKPQPAGYKKCHFVQIATLIWLLYWLSFPEQPNIQISVSKKKFKLICKYLNPKLTLHQVGAVIKCQRTKVGFFCISLATILLYLRQQCTSGVPCAHAPTLRNTLQSWHTEQSLCSLTPAIIIIVGEEIADT